MLRRWSTIVALLVIAAVLWWIYQSIRLPPGVEGKGPPDWLPWITLVVSLVSLLTALVGLATKVLELRQKRT